MRVSGIVVAAGLAATLLGLGSSPSRAAYLITLMESGANVVATGSGSLDLVDLTHAGTGNQVATSIAPFLNVVIAGNPGLIDGYTGFNGPSAFGNGIGSATALTTSGQTVGIALDFILVPNGYTSGDDLGTSTSVFANTSFKDLGLAGGPFVYSFGVGADADSLTIKLVQPVPLPASAPLFGAALASLAAAGYGLTRRPKAT